FAAGLALFSGLAPLAPFSGFGAFFSLSFSLSFSAIDLDSGALGEADFPSTVTLAYVFEPCTGRFAAFFAECKVRNVNRRLFGDDAAFLRTGLLLMALDDVDAAHQRTSLDRMHFDDFTGSSLVAAGEHDDLVALADFCRHHSTSGAREMIFMWFFALNSRGTGPKMRVPTGSICGLIRTAAFRSKRMIEPSARLMSLEMRTTTAFMTSPFFTRPRGMASFTETTITSPMVAYLRLEPPRTLMHITRRAPELSATSRLVCIWIITLSSFCRRARNSQATVAFFSPRITSQRL